MKILYTKEETVEITELSKSLETYLDKLVSNSLNKIAISRRDKIEAVIISIAEYEYIKEASDYIENMTIERKLRSMYAKIENKKIY